MTNKEPRRRLEMNYVEKYIQDMFDEKHFEIKDEPKYFQGKKVVDQTGDFLILEGVPFKNSILVHDKNLINKFIYDEEAHSWLSSSGEMSS